MTESSAVSQESISDRIDRYDEIVYLAIQKAHKEAYRGWFWDLDLPQLKQNDRLKFQDYLEILTQYEILKRFAYGNGWMYHAGKNAPVRFTQPVVTFAVKHGKEMNCLSRRGD